MGDYPWPSEGLDMQPLWINPFENHATVQFIHRCLAILTALILFMLGGRVHGFNITDPTRRLFFLLRIFVIVQVVLGITTLLTHVSLHPAVMHQAGALILLVIVLRIRYEVPPKGYSYDQ